MTGPELNFRVFVSSTFSDLVAERNALQEYAFPRLRDFCRDRGARFQAIDLRWGVSEEATLDQQAVTICMEELRRCQRITPRPNFLVLLGQRYGAHLLPPRIEASEFDGLVASLRGPDRERIRYWYRRDDNAIPAEYCLRPRAGRFAENEPWAAEERELRILVLKAVERSGWPTTDARRVKYETSITHQEILHGALEIEDAAGHVFGFFRTIEGLPDGAAAGAYRDLDPQGRPDEDARERIGELKRQMQSRLPDNIRTYLATWTGTGPSTDHLRQLCADVFDRLSAVIEQEISRRESSGPVALEAAEHAAFGSEHARHFVGRQDTRARIRHYLRSGTRHPLVLHGVSGVGKSALIGRAIAEARERHPEFEVVARFIGATSGSSDLRTLLGGLSQEITLRYGGDASGIPEQLQDLEQDFPERLALARADRQLALFLDALDQVGPADSAARLSWLPRELPPHVRVVISVLEVAEARGRKEQAGSEFEAGAETCLETLSRSLPAQSLVSVRPMTVRDGARLLDAWLSDAGRRLQPPQRRQILDAFSANGLPLYLKVAFEEASRYKSWSQPGSPSGSSPSDVPAVLAGLFARLALPQHHGPVLVNRTLGYLAASRYGLTEDELLDVLSADAEIMADFVSRSPIERAKPVDQRLTALPVVIWSRLRIDFAPYVSERRVGGATVLSFLHREVREFAGRMYLAGVAGDRCHRQLASYFQGKSDPAGDGSWRGNYVRGLSELPYHQMAGQQWAGLDSTLCNLEFIAAACHSALVDNLTVSLDMATRRAPAEESAIRSRLARMRDFVVREGHLLRRYAGTPGFIRQHACNHGLAQARNRGPEGPWFREVRRGETDGALLAVLGEHSEQVNECAVSPGARTIIATSLDRTVRRWDTDTWGRHEIVTVLPAGGTSCDITSDATTIVSGCLDGYVRIHRDGGTTVCEGKFEKYPTRCRFFAGDRRILSIGDSGTLLIHDVASGRLRTRSELGSAPAACSFSPDGRVAIACQDGKVRIYDPGSELITHTLNACVKAFGCSFSADGRYLVAVGGPDLYLMDVKPYGEAVLFEAPDWREIRRPGRKWPEVATGCTFLPDQHRYAVAFHDGEILILDALDHQLNIPVPAHSAHVRSLTTFTWRDRECLATASADSDVRIWDIGLLLAAEGVGRPAGRPVFCAFSSDTAEVRVWSSTVDGFSSRFTAVSHDFTPWSVSPPRVADLPASYPAMREFGLFGRDLAPDMPRDLAVVSLRGMESRNAHRSCPAPGWEPCWMVSVSARLAAHTFHLVPDLPERYFSWNNLTWSRSVDGGIAVLRHQEILIVPPGSTQEITIPLESGGHLLREQPHCLYSRDSARIYVAEGSQLWVIAAGSGDLLGDCELEDEVACISESGEGDSLCAGGVNGMLMEWNWRSGRVRTYLAHPGGVTDCCYVSSEHLISIGNDGVTCLWGQGAPEPLAVFPAAGSLSAFALSPKDNRIVIADVHGEMRFLFLERIPAPNVPPPREASPLAATVPRNALPASGDLIRSQVQDRSLVEYLTADFARISSRDNRAIAYGLLAQLFESHDPATADHLRRAVRGPMSGVDMRAAAAEVERKVFGPSEAITQVSQVIRGIARILNATRIGDFDYALDVAGRVEWPRTRTALLLAIYGHAEADGRHDVMERITSRLTSPV